ncbi:MAG: tetratricopeptide repeat protein [Magnetococcales bacterium]|nr:tetratricopeptide repeat protein [Magnetococcales bacterium]
MTSYRSSSNNSQTQISIDEAYSKAFDFFNCGCFAEADGLCTAIVHQDQNHVQAVNLLGLIAQKIERHELAVEQFRRAIAIDGRYAMLHYNLATSLYHLVDMKKAIDSLEKAVEINPNFYTAHCRLGAAFLQEGMLHKAALSLQKAIAIKPDYAESYFIYGNLLIKEDKLDEAEVNYHKAIALNPDYSDAHYNLGNILKMQNRFDEAITSFQKAIALKPDYAEAYNNLGLTLHEQNRFDDAVVSYQKAISIVPDYVDAHNNIGFTLLAKSKLCTLADNEVEKLLSSLKKAVTLSPKYLNPWCNLLLYLHNSDRYSEAGSLLDRALYHQPDSLVLLLRKIHIIFPIFHKDSASCNGSLEKFNLFINELDYWIKQNKPKQHELAIQVSNMPIFYIAYLPKNHVNQLSRYGDLIAANTESTKPLIKNRAKIRIVIVSNHIRRHSVWEIVLKGIVRHLNRDRFELFLYNTSNISDDETQWAQIKADCYRKLGSEDRHKSSWLEMLHKDRPDVVFFPELAMDSITLFLALHRTAPLQAVGWGHPITSGLPTIDLFFSGELLETDATTAQTHYSEKLICLPGTGCCTEPLPTQHDLTAKHPEIDKIFTGLSGTVFIICQKSFKFHPEDDYLFAQIAKTVGTCSFLIIVDEKLPWATDNIIKRMGSEFQKNGLNPDSYLHIVPWLANDKFLALLKRCDIYLDCPAFSGYTTARQAVNMGLPIVTLEGTFMRQRLAAGLLHQIDLTDTIAQNRQEYINIAVKLAKESQNRQLYKSRRDKLRNLADRADKNVEVLRFFESVIVKSLGEKNQIITDINSGNGKI